MAMRRMFSRRITDSDSFTDMPLSAQALYFHIAMNADDDGFVDGVKRIRRCIGASEDDLKLLIAKRFILPFESGVVVVRQWHVHNYIQKDRYKPTVHTAEKRQLATDDGRYGEKDAYVLKCECAALPKAENPVLTGIPGTVSNMDTECIQNASSGKVRDRDRVRDKINFRITSDSTEGARAREGDCPLDHDDNWRCSTRARLATAAQVVDLAHLEHLPCRCNGQLLDDVADAMEAGVTPERIVDAMRAETADGFTVALGAMLAVARTERENQRRADEAEQARRRVNAALDRMEAEP